MSLFRLLNSLSKKRKKGKNGKLKIANNFMKTAIDDNDHYTSLHT